MMICMLLNGLFLWFCVCCSEWLMVFIRFVLIIEILLIMRVLIVLRICWVVLFWLMFVLLIRLIGSWNREWMVCFFMFSVVILVGV